MTSPCIEHALRSTLSPVMIIPRVHSEIRVANGALTRNLGLVMLNEWVNYFVRTMLNFIKHSNSSIITIEYDIILQ